MATKKSTLPHKHVFPGADKQCRCGEYPICSCNRIKHLSYCECYEKPKKKVTKKRRIDLADPVNMKQDAFKKTKKKTPKYEVKVKIPTTRGNWEFWL